MSSSTTIKRKLLPAKNAWKRLTTMLRSRSRLFLLKRSKIFNRTATGVNAVVSTMLGRRHPPRRFRLKKRALTRLPSDSGRKWSKLDHHRKQHGFVPVYVEDFFTKPTIPVHNQVVQPAVFVGKVLVDKAKPAGGLVAAGDSEESSSQQVITAEPVAVAMNLGKSVRGDLITKTIVGSSTTAGIHQLEGVDLRAELFIAKFKEEMRLQRQRSFQE